jgi:hypothetical protein
VGFTGKPNRPPATQVRPSRVGHLTDDRACRGTRRDGYEAGSGAATQAAQVIGSSGTSGVAVSAPTCS